MSLETILDLFVAYQDTAAVRTGVELDAFARITAAVRRGGTALAEDGTARGCFAMPDSRAPRCVSWHPPPSGS